MKLVTLVQRAAFGLSLAVVAAALLAQGFERSGALARRVRSEIERATGQQVALESIDVDWFASRATLHGLQLGGDDAPIVLNEVEVDLAWREHTLVVERVDVLGGRVTLSSGLSERLRQPSEPRAPAGGASGAELLIVVHGLRLEWLHSDWGRLPIGTVDAVLREVRGSPQVEGRVVPSFAALGEGRPPEIYLTGWRDDAGRISIRASGSKLPISAESFPDRELFARVRSWSPRAKLSFALEASFALDARSPPSGHLRASFEDGSLQPPGTSAPVTDVDLEIDAHGGADDVASLIDPQAWSNTARLTAKWNGWPIEAWAQLGTNAGEGCSARAWVRAPRLPVSRDLLAASGLEARIRNSWNAIDPRGQVDLLCGLQWPHAQSLADSHAALSPRVCVDLDLAGSAGITFHGWPRQRDDRLEGFPLPIDQLTGRVLALHESGADTPTVIGLLQVLGSHSGGTREEQPAFVEGQVRLSQEMPVPAFDLRIGAHAIPVDENLRAALDGLPGTQFIWGEFAPQGGRVSTAIHLLRQGELHIPSSHVSVELFGVGGRWLEIPVPLDDVHGRLEFSGDARAYTGVGFDLRGRTPLGASIHAVGRMQEDPSAVPAHPEPAPHRIQSLTVEAEHVLLKGADRDAIVSAMPEVGKALEPLRAQGHIRVEYRSGTERSGGLRRWRVEAVPEEVVLTPAEFPIRTNDVRGRVLVESEQPAPGSSEKPRTTTRLAPLVGSWLPGTIIGAVAEIPSDADGRVELFAAGIDASNSSLAGAFRDAQKSGLQGGHSGLGLSALNVDGRVDFAGEFTLPVQLPTAPESLYRVYLRDNDVTTNVGGSRFELDRLVGILEQNKGVLSGEEVTATLAGTPILLRGARFEEREGEFRLETKIEALRVPIDREHLRPFLDEKTIHALVDELGWRGNVDLRDTSLVLSGSSARSGGEARFSGYVSPRDMQIDFGVPISIESAEVHVDELVYRRDSVQANARVRKLSGRVADRRLENASLGLEYSDPGLTIRGLEGELEDGRVVTLGGTGDDRPAFAIQLVAPFEFELAIALQAVEVGGLLRGLFQSEFASRGRLSGQLALSGDLRRLTGIRGHGKVSLRDTTLWSIPVVRDLLSQFDLDSTAVFESIETDLRIERGAIKMDEMKVSSPLLKLVGKGTLDFDGTLHHDFEVRYALIDQLGWINQLIYWIQNNIVRIAVRGDMARPRVEIKGLFASSHSRAGTGRDLPLPELAPLPPRF